MQTFVTVLPYIEIGLSIMLIALILLQRSDADLGSAFGGSSDSTKFSRRGMEKTMFNITITIAVMFVAVNLLALVL